MAQITERDKFLEMFTNIRHYSALRFAMLTVFVAMNGGLMTQFFNCAFANNNPEALGLFKIGGAILAIIFFTFERALDHNLVHYWDAIKAYVGKEDALISYRSWTYRVSVPIATHGIYVLTFFFWVYVAADYYPCKLSS